MYTFDLCFAWSWPYDDFFAGLLHNACQAEQISVLQATPANLQGILRELAANNLNFFGYFDRASDGDERFLPLAEWARRQDILYVNRSWLAKRSWDKAAMHSLFTRSGLDAPYTIILPSYAESPDLPSLDLSPLGESFALKPAHGGGGAGVIIGALTWDQILLARQQYPGDEYLLQSKVSPVQIQGRPAWFRIIYCLERVYICWWDPHTHIYTPISEAAIQTFELGALDEICRQIARLTHLELFSTEIALVDTNRFFIVDYINDPIDLRPKSRMLQGVPDPILAQVAQSLAALVSTNRLYGASYAG